MSRRAEDRRADDVRMSDDRRTRKLAAPVMRMKMKTFIIFILFANIYYFSLLEKLFGCGIEGVEFRLYSTPSLAPVHVILVANEHILLRASNRHLISYAPCKTYYICYPDSKISVHTSSFHPSTRSI